MGINEGDTYLTLKLRDQWRFRSKEALIAALDKEVSDIPGVAFSFTQPMAMRMDETVSGVKADLAVKIFGDDFRTLDTIGQQVLRSVARVAGAADPQMEITSGVAELSVQVRRDALARYGLNASDVEEAVAAGASGDVISEVVDGQKRYTVALRLPDRYRTDADAMRAILLRAPAGEQVALDQVADIGVTRGPEKIEREEGQRRVVVMSNVRGRDLGSFVDDVRARITRDVTLPPGYFIEYGGQFENQRRAMTALVASVGFIPMAIATSTGAEVQRPLASVVIGGLVSSTVLTLILLPVLYDWVFQKERRTV